MSFQNFRYFVARLLTGVDYEELKSDKDNFLTQTVLDLKQALKEERSNNNSLRAELSERKPAVPTAEAVIDNILKRPIAWVDRSKMDVVALKQWGGHARSLLDNPLFEALCGRGGHMSLPDTSGELVKDIIEHIARRSKDHSETRDLRMTMNGIELIRERAISWLYIDKEPTNDNPNAAM